MAEEFILSFAGSGEDTARACKLYNGTNAVIRNVGISARTAKFPITWDYFEAMDGSATLLHTEGLDTEVIFFYFANFNAGEVVYFNAIDPDFSGDNNSWVQVGAIAGSRVIVVYEDGTSGFGELQIDKGTLQAVISKS